MHAVDVPRFAEFLEQPLGAVLWYHANHCGDRDKRLWFTDAPAGAYIYNAISGDGVYTFTSGQRYPLPEAKWTQIEFLNTKTRDHLNGGSPYDLDRLLDSLAMTPTAGFVEPITWGHRRWWIGSLLDYAASALEITAQDFDRLRTLFQRVLCGRDCGWPLPEVGTEESEPDFPVHPYDEPGFSMAAWTSEEARFVTGGLRRISDQKPRFNSPPGPVGIAPEAQEDWNDWIHEMIQQLLKIDQLDFDDMRIVSFIDG
jgi:hypothetical protein